MTSLAIDSAAQLQPCTWPVRLGLRRSPTAIKWWMSVMYASKREWDPDAMGVRYVESRESTETRSPDKAHRGWWMANDSTRSSAMSDVLVVLFTFIAHWSLPHTRMHEGVKQFVLPICQFVSLSVRWKILNLNIDGFKRFPKLTVALKLWKKVTYVYLIGSKAVLYLLFQQFPI